MPSLGSEGQRRGRVGRACTCFIRLNKPIGSAEPAASTPPIIAPMTPTVVTSDPEKKRFSIGARGRSHWVRKRRGVGSRP